MTEGDEIKKYIPSFDKGKYEGKLIIRNDKLVYIGQGDKEEYNHNRSYRYSEHLFGA